MAPLSKNASSEKRGFLSIFFTAKLPQYFRLAKQALGIPAKRMKFPLGIALAATHVYVWHFGRNQS